MAALHYILEANLQDLHIMEDRRRKDWESNKDEDEEENKIKKKSKGAPRTLIDLDFHGHSTI